MTMFLPLNPVHAAALIAAFCALVPAHSSVPADNGVSVQPGIDSPSYWEGGAPHSSPSTPLLLGGPSEGSWVLRWQDEFLGDSLDKSLWGYRVDAKFGSAQLPENVSVSGGMLVLTLRAQEARGKHYTGAGVVSKRAFLHGYYEARIRFPDASGWWSAFWLMKNSAGGKANAGTRDALQEIDIIEYGSGLKARDGYQIAIHWWRGSHFVLGPSKVRVPFPLATDFHIYGFDYGERLGVCYLDGRKVAEVDLSRLPQQEPMSIWLTSIQGMANRIETAKLPTRMEVDYVRFFQSQ